ncbi:hypothetical protein WNY37_03190 [Henriciella sp. AS95]|uniref:TraR/DksA family transcriptional regulator n=1 Tax=Henriciella sp. AS95 TaxID=3135782 RepID=UPI00316F352A
MTRQSGPRPSAMTFIRTARPSGDDGGDRTTMPVEGEATLKRIDAALRRLDTGRFGHCLYCGDQINMSRLTHDPATESCTTCDED